LPWRDSVSQGLSSTDTASGITYRAYHFGKVVFVTIDGTLSASLPAGSWIDFSKAAPSPVRDFWCHAFTSGLDNYSLRVTSAGAVSIVARNTIAAGKELHTAFAYIAAA
jgi:hypothetical protein